MFNESGVRLDLIGNSVNNFNYKAETVPPLYEGAYSNYVTGKLGRLEYSNELESGELPD